MQILEREMKFKMKASEGYEIGRFSRKYEISWSQYFCGLDNDCIIIQSIPLKWK